MTATAIAISDPRLEREVLEHLRNARVDVVRRCICAADVETLNGDVQILTDATFLRRHQVAERPGLRIIGGAAELHVESSSEARGRLIAFAGTSGGVGTTTIALYSAMLAPTAQRILVIDGQLHSPNAHLFTTAVARIGGLTRSQEQLDVECWSENVFLLSGIDAPSRRHQITSALWQGVLRRAICEFDEVRVDIGTQLCDEHPVIEETLARADATVLVSSAHPASVIHARTCADVISAHGSRAIHVLNGVEPGPISETALRILAGSGVAVAASVPRDDEAFAAAFVAASGLAPRSSAARAIETINAQLLHPEAHQPRLRDRVRRVVPLHR